MMAADLEMDWAALDAVVADLRRVRDEFAGAEDGTRDAAAASGDDHLAERVQAFASDWSVRRENMGSDLTKLHDALKQIVDSFTQVDADLSSSLDSSASDGRIPADGGSFGGR